MITKEHALAATEFMQIAGDADYCRQNQLARYPFRAIKWRRNGATQVWKSASRSEHFRIPIKHGLYSYGYIEFTNSSDNRELFEVIV